MTSHLFSRIYIHYLVLFHDCGDRVAQMLLLALTPPATTGVENLPTQQFLLVNTHLLFPHNEQSTKIRLREITKLLGFVESYRQRELCSSLCGRSDVRIPVIITGDLNGDQDDKVNHTILHSSMSNLFPALNSRDLFTNDCISGTAVCAESEFFDSSGVSEREAGHKLMDLPQEPPEQAGDVRSRLLLKSF